MHFWGFNIILSWIEEQKIEYTLTACWVCRSISNDGPPGHWHRDGVLPGAPANARWQSWAPLRSFQASSTIEYFSLEMISQGVFVNPIASLNRFGTSKVAISCWGTLWSPPAIGWESFWSQPSLGSGSACTKSVLRDMLMVDIWCLSNGGAMARTGCRRFGSEARAMTLSAWLRSFGSGTLVVYIVLSLHA